MTEGFSNTTIRTRARGLLALLLACWVPGCHARWNPLGSAPPYHFRTQAAQGVINTTVDGTLSDEDAGYAAGFRYEVPAAGTLFITAKSVSQTVQLDIDVFSEGSLPIATTSNASDKKLKVEDIQTGTIYVVVHESWKEAQKTRFKLGTVFCAAGEDCRPDQAASQVARTYVPQLADRGAATPPPLSQSPTARLATIGAKRVVAVLDFKSYVPELKPENVRYFADSVRAALLQLDAKVDVVTRENLVALLQSSGKALENCEGECEVDTGRRIGADLIVSGEIQRVGSKLKLTMRLHETHEGKLLGASVASGKDIDELDEELAKTVSRLFQNVK